MMRTGDCCERQTSKYYVLYIGIHISISSVRDIKARSPFEYFIYKPRLAVSYSLQVVFLNAWSVCSITHTHTSFVFTRFHLYCAREKIQYKTVMSLMNINAIKVIVMIMRNYIQRKR